jgi:hypothetical protein
MDTETLEMPPRRGRWKYRKLRAADWKLTLERYGVDYCPPLGGLGGQVPPERIEEVDDDTLIVTFKNRDEWEIKRLRRA